MLGDCGEGWAKRAAASGAEVITRRTDGPIVDRCLRRQAQEFTWMQDGPVIHAVWRISKAGGGAG